MSFKDDWNSMGTEEKCLSMGDNREDFLELLGEAESQGFLTVQDVDYFKRLTPNTEDYNDIVKWFYERKPEVNKMKKTFRGELNG